MKTKEFSIDRYTVYKQEQHVSEAGALSDLWVDVDGEVIPYQASPYSAWSFKIRPSLIAGQTMTTEWRVNFFLHGSLFTSLRTTSMLNAALTAVTTLENLNALPLPFYDKDWKLHVIDKGVTVYNAPARLVGIARDCLAVFEPMGEHTFWTQRENEPLYLSIFSDEINWKM